jgi:hypothetical protein
MKLPEGVDPQSPAFQAATQACAKYQPKNGGLDFRAEPGGGKAGPGLSSQSTP